jgi:hypothetical protein
LIILLGRDCLVVAQIQLDQAIRYGTVSSAFAFQGGASKCEATPNWDGFVNNFISMVLGLLAGQWAAFKLQTLKDVKKWFEKQFARGSG